MARDELATILDGRPITNVVPPYPDEHVEDYAIRATGELMVLYLSGEPRRDQSVP